MYARIDISRREKGGEGVPILYWKLKFLLFINRDAGTKLFDTGTPILAPKLFRPKNKHLL